MSTAACGRIVVVQDLDRLLDSDELLRAQHERLVEWAAAAPTHLRDLRPSERVRVVQQRDAATELKHIGHRFWTSSPLLAQLTPRLAAAVRLLYDDLVEAEQGRQEQQRTFETEKVGA